MRRFTRFAGPVLVAALAGPAPAQTDFTALTDSERAIFHEELRAVLLTVPELLPDAAPAPAPAEIYRDEIARDRARLAAHGEALFSTDLPGFGPRDAAQTIALFTRPGCAACARAEAGLRALAPSHDLRVTLLDMDAHTGLARALGIDMAPSYVLDDMMLRGALPPVVLKRYLAE
jgi:uncharacterized protein YceK